MTETQVARSIFLIFFGLLALGAFLLPRAYIYQGASSRAAWRDLRLWVLVLVILHAGVYWFFA
jgi:hypothetical protein